MNVLMNTPNYQYLNEVIFDGQRRNMNTRFYCDADLEYTDEIDDEVVNNHIDELV